jgi:hypothetical protein
VIHQSNAPGCQKAFGLKKSQVTPPVVTNKKEELQLCNIGNVWQPINVHKCPGQSQSSKAPAATMSRANFGQCSSDDRQ